MKAIVIILLFFIYHFTLGQSDTVFMRYDMNIYDDTLTYSTDTIIFDSVDMELLYGTTILPSTGNQQYAKGYGLHFNNVIFSDCSKGERPTGEIEILSIIESDSTIIFDCKIFGNCCHSFLCDVEIKEDSILNLIYYGYGAGYCACNCCFGLIYEFDFYKEHSDFDELKFVMINNEKQSLIKLESK